MGVKYEVSAVVGTYTDKNGQEKKRYHNCGVILETKNGGLMMKLEAVPLGGDGTFWLNEPRERDAKPHQKPGENLPRSDYDDPIPF